MKRFWSKVDKRAPGGCWNWTAYKCKYGYGRFGVSGKAHYAHRFAYELTVGKIPEGMCICHTCDNPGCVNPGHMFVGTQRDNVADCVRKRRHASGERHNHAKLTAAQAREIRSRYTGVYGQQIELAREFGVSPDTVNAICTGRTWACT